MTLKTDAKREEKLTHGLENSMKNLANIHENTWKSQIWDFDVILLSTVENARAKSLQRSYVTAKFEEELTCHFTIDMRNFTSFDSSTLKSHFFTLTGSFWPNYLMFDSNESLKNNNNKALFIPVRI